MISITQHIEFLMMYNDCVLIPGWGALIANYTSSHMHGDTMISPCRNIGFNANITHNDGLLANSIARRNGISYTEACNIIASSVESFKSQLNAGNPVALGRLGLFKLNNNGKMVYEPFSQEDAFNEFFGLKNLKLNTLSQEDAPQAIITGNLWRERMKAAASIAAIIAAGLLFSTPVIIDRSTQSASMNVIEVKTKPAQIVCVKKAASTTAADNKIALVNADGSVATVDNHDQDTFNPGMPSDLNGSRLLVINTCNKAKQAQKMVARYAKKGIKTRIVACGKYHHIVAAQSNSESELRKAKALLPASCRNAWVCKK